MNIKNAADGLLATGGMSAPWWIEHLSTGLGLFTLAGGAVLMVIRLMIAWREWKHPKNED